MALNKQVLVWVIQTIKDPIEAAERIMYLEEIQQKVKERNSKAKQVMDIAKAQEKMIMAEQFCVHPMVDELTRVCLICGEQLVEKKSRFT